MMAFGIHNDQSTETSSEESSSSSSSKILLLSPTIGKRTKTNLLSSFLDTENVHPNKSKHQSATKLKLSSGKKLSTSNNNVSLVVEPTAKRHKTTTILQTILQDTSNHPKVGEKGNDEIPQQTTLPTTPTIQCVEYPCAIAVPGRNVVAKFYQDSLVLLANDKDNNKDNSSFGQVGDQQYLQPAGLLSLEQVLLPALAWQENHALKALQAKIQRDAPHLTHHIQACRHWVLSSVGAAILQVQQARQTRFQVQQERQLGLEQERQAAQEARILDKEQERQRLLEEKKQRQLTKQAQTLKSIQRQHPRNQDLWREVAFLMTEKSKLEKEERLWKQAERDLIQLEEEQQRQQQEALGETDETETTNDKQDASSPPIIEAPKDPLQVKVEQAVDDIRLSSDRIHQGLKIVLHTIQESDKVRKELYQTYRKDHQFHGYQGFKNPKSLIRFLSQEEN
jgi:hypothetical protein